MCLFWSIDECIMETLCSYIASEFRNLSRNVKEYIGILHTGMWCNWYIWNIGGKLGKSVLIKKSEFSNIYYKAHRTIGITFFLTRPLWNLLLKPTKIKWQIFGSHRQFSTITRFFWDCGKTKQKWYFVTKIVLTYCEKELF